MASTKARKFDIVLFGATGFTGERIALYIARSIYGLPAGGDTKAGAEEKKVTPASPAVASIDDAKASARKRTFAIAGRSAQRLSGTYDTPLPTAIVDSPDTPAAVLASEVRARLYKQLCADSQAALGTPFTTKEEDLCAVIAGVDVKDEASLTAMSSTGRVCINAVGPYRFFGESVVKACLTTQTHYIDITGETEWMEKMYVLYDADARKAGITVVSACGFDSLTADLGVVFTHRAFGAAYPDGALSRVESVLRVDGGSAGVTGHATTLEALLESIASISELRKSRKVLKAKQTESCGEIARVGRDIKPGKIPVVFDKRVNRYTLPFMGSDASVVRNSAYQMYASDVAAGQKKPYPYYSAYFSLPSLFAVVMAIVMGILLAVASKFSVTRWVMNRWPHWCTWGFFTHAGPTAKQLAETRTTMDFFGTGYAAERDIPTDPKAKAAPGSTVGIHTTITGPEPGYILCSIVCGQSAFTLLDEFDAKTQQIPAGVMTPAPAFRNTDLIERLHAEGGMTRGAAPDDRGRLTVGSCTVRFTVQEVKKQ